MAILIKPDGSATEVNPRNGETFSLDELQEYVEGWIQVIYMKDGRPLVLNEESKLLELKMNARATLIARNAGIADWDHIAGNALLCEKGEVE